MSDISSTPETSPKTSSKGTPNGQAAAPATAEEALSELEAAVTEPNGGATAAPEPSPDSDDGALAEIEEAISDGEDEDPIDVEETNLSYPIRKPFRSKKRFEFFTTHPDPNLWIKAWVVIENQGMEEEYYLPIGSVKGDLMDHVAHVQFVPCLTSRGKIFIWPIPCDDVTSRKNKWTQSARDGAKEARTRLTKILSDTEEGKYRIFHPRGNVPMSEWPEDFNRKTMLARMFQDHILRDLDNDVARAILNAGSKIEK